MVQNIMEILDKEDAFPAHAADRRNACMGSGMGVRLRTMITLLHAFQ